jgi:hypothetical protein
MGKLRLLLFVALVATISACGDDGTEPGPLPPSSLKNLTQREDVILNFESAYNQRRVDWYEGILDASFTFFLSTGDVNNGLPASWNRADEVAIHIKMFDSNGFSMPVQSIFMDIRTEDGVSWIESDSPSNPGEKWYTATLYYDYKFEIDPNTYIPLTGAKVTLIVRDAGAHGKYAHHWQLVELHDLGDTLFAAGSGESSTLGAVKALFR